MKAKFGTCGKDDTEVMVVDGKGKPFKLVIGDTAVSLVDDAGDKIEVSRNALYQQYKVWTPPKQDFNSGICSWVCVCANASLPLQYPNAKLALRAWFGAHFLQRVLSRI